MKNRPVSEDERRLFEQSLDTGRVLNAAPVKQAQKTRAKPASKMGGVNQATQDRLMRGKLEPELSIDLHGLTQALAHHRLHASLARAHQQGKRLVLVITGKGKPAKEYGASWALSAHGVLKEMVPRWLGEPKFASFVAMVRPAHLRHGGVGALYVYLRKNR